MGCSCDWERTRFTLDELCSRAVRRTFFNLFKAGKIFRGKRLINWDTQLRTAVADDEIYYEEVAGHLWTIKYPIAGSPTGEVLHIATTRPETMLGDTAVAVHPDDARYKHLIGKHVELAPDRPQDPDHRRPPPGRPGLRHRRGQGHARAMIPTITRPACAMALPMINLLNPDGTYNENAGKYAGIDRLRVRKRVVEDLKALDLLERVDSYLVRLNHSDRSKTPIEPYLSDQWFVRMGDDAGRRRRALRSKRWTPSPRDAWRFTPNDTPRAISTGSAKSATGASAASSGGAIAFRSGTARTCTEDDLERAFAGRVRCGLEPGRDGRLARLRRDRPERRRAGARPYLGSRPRRARYLVQLGPLAALDPGLAGRDARAQQVLSHQRPVDGPRHHHALGRPDGDLRPVQPRRSAVSRRLYPPDHPGRPGQTDVEVGGQRRRPGRHHRDLRRRRPALTRWRRAPPRRRTCGFPVEPLTLPDGRIVNTSERFELGRNFANKFWNAARLALMNLEGYEPAHARAARSCRSRIAGSSTAWIARSAR